MVIKEVLAMRKLLVLLPLILAGCGSDGTNFGTAPQPAELEGHTPQIAGLDLSPGYATFMDGGGSTSVTVEFDFTDTGLDIATVHVEISDGTSFTVPFPDTVITESGTHTEQFEMSTAAVGAYTVEIWLVDKLGATSNHEMAVFNVVAAAHDDNWTNRLAGLPFALNDVTWDGDRFIVVGDGGVILTSPDGVDWAERASGTDVDLAAIAHHGMDVVAVGRDTTVLLSTDHGESWTVKHSRDDVFLRAVAINESQIVAGGMDLQTGDAFMMRSLDVGENWTVIESLPQRDHFVTDLVYANGLFIAATDVFSWLSDGRVLVSLDGENWQSIVLRDEVAASYAILHDGERFIAAGGEGTVFTSVDGFYWTELQTPAEMERITFMGAAWSGSRLVIHGGITWWYWWLGVPPYQEAGISSTDGGATWEIVDIDGYYETHGMAWGHGRFVSVGQTSPVTVEGAIYTSP
jgi:photosystem II stability/assembly factor-like uncharacterized protein